MDKVKAFFRDESGGVPAIYGLVVALLATAVLLAVAFWGAEASD